MLGSTQRMECNMLVLSRYHNMRPSLFIFTRWRPLVATVAMAAKEDVRVEGLVWDFHPLCVLYSWTTVSAVRVKKSWMVVIRPEKQECYGWLLPYMYSYSSPLQLPNNVVVEKGCGGGGESQILDCSPSQAGRTKTSSLCANIPRPKGIL